MNYKNLILILFFANYLILFSVNCSENLDNNSNAKIRPKRDANFYCKFTCNPSKNKSCIRQTNVFVPRVIYLITTSVLKWFVVMIMNAVNLRI